MKPLRPAAGLLSGLLLALLIPGTAAAVPVPVPRDTVAAPVPAADPPPAGPGASGPDLSSANRTGPPDGMPDWSRVGYRGGRQPPSGETSRSTDAACRITPAELASGYQVRPDDGVDDTAGLQKAIDDIRSACSPTANFDRLSLIELPAGRVDLSRQVYVDADFLTLRGQGSGEGGTRLVFRPDLSTRYDTVINGRWDQDGMVAGTGSDVGTGGWMWPGRGMFRVQTRDVAERYKDDWAAASTLPMRKDIFEGSVNQHWVSGIKVAARDGDPGFAGRQGHTVVRLDPKADMKKFRLGGYVWVGAANSRKFYEQQGVTDPGMIEALHMRQQMFRATGVDVNNKTITLDRPLEWDLPVNSESDGSDPLTGSGTPYASKVTPLKAVEGVGFEDFAFTQDMNGLPKIGGQGTYDLTPDQAVHNYGNLAPEYAMHGIVFKWAANSWARGLKAEMTGSHPIVTENARNLQIERNSFDGAWNKGKGGNGYLRGSRVWDSLWAHNLSRNLRHFTFQWSAGGNVAFRNDLDSDLNLHGGWEHNNLFEQNTVRIPYEHRSGSCRANCGGEGGEIDEGTWYPIWWAAGPKAGKWSGSSGPQNVFYNNTLVKQTTPGGPFEPYAPYGTRSGTAFRFGSADDDPRRFLPLGQAGQPIADWTGREALDYRGQGVATLDVGKRHSLFLRDTGGEIEPRDEARRNAITWNMLGSGVNRGNFKWTSGVRALADTNDADVIALQEAGTPPPGSEYQRPGTLALIEQSEFGRTYGDDPRVNYPPVREYRIGTAAQTHGYVYWLHTDTNRLANTARANLAVWTRDRVYDPILEPNAEGRVFVVPGRTAAGVHTGRPALGVRVGDVVYFTLHGDSQANGTDVPVLLANIEARMRTAGPNGTPLHWVALGDFNREPLGLALELGGVTAPYRVRAGEEPTYPAGRPVSRYDYAVLPRTVGDAPNAVSAAHITRLDLPSAGISDHHPVLYEFSNLPNSGPRPVPRPLARTVPTDTPVVLRNAGSSAAAARSGSGTGQVVDLPVNRANRAAQEFTLQADPEYPGYFRVLHTASGAYLGQSLPATGAPVVLQNEDRGPTQLWLVVDQGDGTWVLENMATSQILTAVPWSTGEEPQGREFDQADPAQRWFLQPPDEAEAVDEIDLVDATTVPLVLNVEYGDTAEGTPVNVSRDQDLPSERIRLIYAGRSGNDSCYYLTYGGKYINSTAAGSPPQSGNTVTLNAFRPDDDGFMWRESPNRSGVSLSNHTASGERLHLDTHGMDAQLTVRLFGPDEVPPVWRYERTS
ncbi:RICIN domain-containing protein [Kitasatospora sp. NPDC001527]|uniref:RICIN domain-containing protein n=1 Tax=Kitasatospora sp. NPDC001527 TaxID=3154519 RepID=UPI0033323C04